MTYSDCGQEENTTEYNQAVKERDYEFRNYERLERTAKRIH